MSDYIKREDALFVAYQQPFYSVVSQIKQLEGVDIVRCKECKRSYIEGQTTLYRVCGLHDITTDENNYCSWAEREDE